MMLKKRNWVQKFEFNDFLSNQNVVKLIHTGHTQTYTTIFQLLKYLCYNTTS